MTTFTIHEAKTNLSKLIARATSGEEIVILRGKVPVARLEPLRVPEGRRFGAMKGRACCDEAFFEPLPEEELSAWES
ncbi:MAG: antitoxin [Alphaproteobacteria bacterium]|nr:antitoxin [Alphaproteobacteria bacterium]